MDIVRVYNAGIPGDTTAELLQRFDRDVAVHQPDVVCLLIGSNDMLYPGHMLELDEFRSNLENLLDRISDLDSGVILMTAPRFITSLLLENYPDTAAHPQSPEKRLEQLNCTIREVALLRGIAVVDLYKLIDPVDESPESMILNWANSRRRDGMHLTAAGNEAAARAAAGVCRRRFPEAGCIVWLGDSLTYGVYMPGKGSARADAQTYPGILCKLLSGEAG